MNILILSSMTNKHFLEDFKLGNYFIAHGHNVMVADINQVNSTMNSVYDVVLFRNFVPEDLSKLDSIKALYEEKMAIIPDVVPVYQKYNVGLYIDVSLALNIPLCERAKEGVGYSLTFPYRIDYIVDNKNFVIQKVYEKYYHSVIVDGSIIYSFSESKGLRKIETDTHKTITSIADYLKSQEIDMAEVVYVIDDNGNIMLSHINATHITLDNRLCDENKLYSHILDVIERKK